MASFRFKPDQKLTDVLSQGKFTLSAEVIPPRNGTEQGKVLDQIEALVGSGAKFLAVTKGAGGSLRGGSLPIAQAVKEQFGVPCIAHFTCRDLTAQEVENSLMDHHYFGIRNILALRGDPPDGQPQWQAREGGYNYAYELIGQIKNLNQGIYLPRAGGPAAQATERTDFCIGAAAYPEHPNEEERARFFKLKIDAGAEYGITDMLFDPEIYARFLDLLNQNGIQVPILPGTRILKTQAQAKRLAEKFRVTVPQTTFARLAADEAALKQDPSGTLANALEIFEDMVAKLRSYGAPGVHLYVIADTPTSCEGLKRLASRAGNAVTGSAASGARAAASAAGATAAAAVAPADFL